MKKIIIFILCAAISMSIAGCKSSIQNKEADQQNASIGSDKQTNETVNQSPSKEQDVQTTNESGTPAQNNNGESRVQSSNSPKGEITFSIDSGNKLEFSAETIDGLAVDSSIFEDYKLTMINIWGTSCKPCIGEMPDIQEVYEEMEPEGVNVLGFVANSSTDTVEKVKEILREKGVTYTNIAFFANEEVANRISKQSAGFPGTIFVNSKGNIVGNQISGTRSKEEYKKEIDDRLKMLGN